MGLDGTATLCVATFKSERTLVTRGTGDTWVTAGHTWGRTRHTGCKWYSWWVVATNGTSRLFSGKTLLDFCVPIWPFIFSGCLQFVERCENCFGGWPPAVRARSISFNGGRASRTRDWRAGKGASYGLGERRRAATLMRRAAHVPIADWTRGRRDAADWSSHGLRYSGDVACNDVFLRKCDVFLSVFNGGFGVMTCTGHITCDSSRNFPSKLNRLPESLK